MLNMTYLRTCGTRNLKARLVAQLFGVLVVLGCVNAPDAPNAPQTMKDEAPLKTKSQEIQASEAEKPSTKNNIEPPHILVFTKTKAYRHKNISDGVRALREIGLGKYVVEQTEDAGVFTTKNLNRFAAVVFLSTTGDVLNTEQQNAFEQYIHAGGGYVGIHAAADTEYEWPWYGQLIGAWFKDHTKVIWPPCAAKTRSISARLNFQTHGSEKTSGIDLEPTQEKTSTCWCA